ncbi:MAG: M14 family metallopeptidase [Acidobacteria bacterium]|nr:M14 family metallopeptidase [Acidobacteriota bacterium]
MKPNYPPMPPLSGYESPAAKEIKSLAASTAASPQNLLTHCERTNYDQSGRYGEVFRYALRMKKHSPFFKSWSFGKSGQDRDLMVYCVSEDKAFKPDLARKSDKLVVLIQNGIHPGEISGKDASFMLIRDILVSKKYAHWLENLTLLFIPVFNVDGHERLSPFSRINQNGPREMGFRANAQRYNLNRDYIKADTPEMRAWLKLWNTWLPDFFMDNHVTDGLDHQYDVTICMPTEQEIWPTVGDWTKNQFLPSVMQGMEADGHIIGYYYEPMDRLDLSEGVEGGPNQARYSNGYVATHHRPGLLVETHSLKTHRTQTWAHYDLMVNTLEYLSSHASELKQAVQAADAGMAALGSTYQPSNKLFMAGITSDESEHVLLKGIASSIEEGEISGAPYVVYGTEPVDIPSQFYNKITTVAAPSVPLGYIVPPQWRQIIDLLRLHGVETKVLNQPVSDVFESYIFSNASWAPQPFEGRLLVDFSAQLTMEKRVMPRGSVFVPMNQRAARVAMNLLEPEACDSAVKWGFFNPIFEQKEDFEAYVMEPIAQRLCELDPELHAEFEARLEEDEAFAADPKARLNFFYKRSGYLEPDMNQYPVVRVIRPLQIAET